MGATPHSFLVSNAKAVLVASVISWHFARCGENGYCIPTNEAQTSLRATIGTGPGLINTLPKILGSSTLSGLMLLPGCVRGGRSDDRLWAKIGLTLLPALFTQFVIAPVFDHFACSPIPTDGHVWFLYSLAFARALLELTRRCGLGRGATLAVMLALNCLAAPAMRVLYDAAPSLSGARYDGLTWSSGEWFLPIGVRCLTFACFYAFGALVLPLPWLLELRRRCAASAGAQATVWLANVASWVYSLERLRLAGTNLVVSASPDEWWRRLPMHVEMMVVMLASTSALLLWLPDRRIALLTWAGERTLLPYLLHPFLLKVLRGPVRSIVEACVFGIGGRAFFDAPGDRALLLVGILSSIPPALLVALAFFSSALTRAARPFGSAATPGLAVLIAVGLCARPFSGNACAAAATGALRPAAAPMASLDVTAKAHAGASITLRNAEVVDSLAHDVYTCQAHDTSAAVLPHGTPEDWAVRRVVVGAPSADAPYYVHHVTAFVCDEAAVRATEVRGGSLGAAARAVMERVLFRCEKIPFVPGCESMLFTFAPHDAKVAMPRRTAVIFGGLTLLQVHYARKGAALAAPVPLEPIATTLELVERRAARGVQLLQFFELGPRHPDMLVVPPRQTRHVVSSVCAPSCVRAAGRRSASGTFKIYGIRHHMHLLGRAMTTEVVHANGSSTTIHTSDTWDPFAPLAVRWFDAPITLRPTDAIVARCVYNSEGKREPTTLGASLRTSEMCFSYMLVSHVPGFSSCWHIARGAPAESDTCFGVCKGLGQGDSLRDGLTAGLNSTKSTAKRFKLPAPAGEGLCAGVPSPAARQPLAEGHVRRLAEKGSSLAVQLAVPPPSPLAVSPPRCVCKVSSHSKDGFGHQMSSKLSCIASAAAVGAEYVSAPLDGNAHGAHAVMLQKLMDLGFPRENRTLIRHPSGAQQTGRFPRGIDKSGGHVDLVDACQRFESTWLRRIEHEPFRSRECCAGASVNRVNNCWDYFFCTPDWPGVWNRVRDGLRSRYDENAATFAFPKATWYDGLPDRTWGKKVVVHARRGDNAIVRQVLGDVQYLRVIDKLRNELGAPEAPPLFRIQTDALAEEAAALKRALSRPGVDDVVLDVECRTEKECARWGGKARAVGLAFHRMVTADVLVMSISSLSEAAAFMRAPGAPVYFPDCWSRRRALPEWRPYACNMSLHYTPGLSRHVVGPEGLKLVRFASRAEAYPDAV